MTGVGRLNQENLDQSATAIPLPGYDRAAVATGIVHLGVGNFHRGHQAVFTDDVLANGDKSWGITGVSLRSPATRDAMRPQDFLYSVNFRDGDAETLRVIGAITNVLCAPENPQRVLDALCSADVKIVSLTITEKGYIWPKGKVPDWTPSKFHRSSASALLYIVEALHTRMSCGVSPFTLLSCDNLAANGSVLKKAVVNLAQHKDPSLALFLSEELACPSSMVDRIVPQPTEKEISTSIRLLGLKDKAAIATEPFCQWVIEDNFPAGRPDWSICEGVEFTSDVRPYEEMKLRLLNGAHTFIALYGQLTNRTYVSEVMKSSEALGFLDHFWRSSSHTLQIDHSLTQYTDSLIQRFQNESLFHKTSQIVTDTSQKLPQRILEPLLMLAEAGGDTRSHNTVIAIWFEYLRRSKSVQDPLSENLVSLARNGDIMNFVAQLPLFPRNYRQNPVLVAELASIYKKISKVGAEQFVADFPQH